MPRSSGSSEPETSTLDGIDIDVPPAQLIEQLLDKIVFQAKVLDTLKREVDDMKDQYVASIEENESLKRQLHRKGAPSSKVLQSPSSRGGSTNDQLRKSRRMIDEVESSLMRCEDTLYDLHEVILKDADEKREYLSSMSQLVVRYLDAKKNVAKEDFEKLVQSIADFKMLMARNIERISTQHQNLVDRADEIVERYRAAAGGGGRPDFKDLATIEAAALGNKHRRSNERASTNKTFKIDENGNVLIKNDEGYSETDLVIGDTIYTEELVRQQQRQNKKLQEFIKGFESLRQQGQAIGRQQQQEKKDDNASLKTPKSSVTINGRSVPLPPRKNAPALATSSKLAASKPAGITAEPRQSFTSKIPTISVGLASKKKPLVAGRTAAASLNSRIPAPIKKVSSNLNRATSSSTIIISKDEGHHASDTRAKALAPPVVKKVTAAKPKLTTSTPIPRREILTRQSSLGQKKPSTTQPIIVMTEDDKFFEGISEILHRRLDETYAGDEQSRPEIVQVRSKADAPTTSVVKSMVNKINSANDKPDFFYSSRDKRNDAAGKDTLTALSPITESAAAAADSTPYASKPVRRRLFSDDQTDHLATSAAKTVTQQKKQPSSFFYMVSR